MIRPVWVEVDLNKIKENVLAIKKVLKPETKFMSVVKANGYGHGSVEVAKSALSTGANRLGIALVEEAIALREAGIEAPIHLLTGPPKGSASIIRELDLIPTVFSKAHLDELKSDIFKVHVKIDTGMNRIGLKPEDLDGFLVTLRKYPNITAEGLFTHFATADNPQSFLFKKQLQLFSEVANKYRDDFEIIHAANSAAMLLSPESHFDMVRIGISMYGLKPCLVEIPVKIKPALSWKAKVSHAKKIKKGESVSYGARYTAEENQVIATIPVGYADGYFRSLSNKSQFISNGKTLPQVGTICMDQMMFLDKDGDIEIGDEIILMGQSNGISFTADNMAKILKTINYEIVCAISNRVERTYLES